MPTSHKSATLYANRYRDCGEGVLEVTLVIHNDANVNTEDSNDMKAYTLWSVILSDPTGEIHHQFPMQQYGKGKGIALAILQAVQRQQVTMQ